MLPPPDHSACGVGFVVSTSPKHTRTVVKLALSALERLEHRGGLGADGESSDGAGILAGIPWRLYRPWLVERGVWGAAGEGTAVGMVFLPRDEGKRRLSRDLVEKALHDEGLAVVGWRPVPTRPDVLSASAETHRPEIEQVFATSPQAGDALERVLLLARRRIGRMLASQQLIRRLDDLYLCSLSGRTIVYKGMLSSTLLPRFYEDLTDPDFVSHFAVFHRRFSTNTLPKWSLAQPMRMLAHNGEINTLSGNLAWTRAREPDLSHPIWGDRMSDLLPPIHGDSSDSGALDKMLEFLVRSGRSPFEALMILMPESYEHRLNKAGAAAGRGGTAGREPAAGQRDRTAEFYDYYSGVQEAWDGPAMVAFGDGDMVGACVDRNGLRPARYALSASGILAVASEAGAVLDGEDVVERGRLGPGQMIAVDLASGEVHRDEAIKRRIAAERPYGTWVQQQRRSLGPGSFPEAPLDDETTLLRRQMACGYSAEDVDAIIRPMAERGREPRFAMGNDAPLAILSSKPHTLYDYFAERFAQVTNPPIDPLRERLVMSLSMKLGQRGNLLVAQPEHARQVEPASPVLN
ncbi:MAG TPA: glutamate synthase central domain-containing protein, partial [Thermoleophilia bacterium]|nr:glutamate synthase central domain-containing protein [Thermoleophilia bacterium]